MMVSNSDLTIVVIDSMMYDATKLALDETKKIFPEAKVLIISDQKFYDCDTFVQVEKFDKFGHSRLCLDAGQYIDTNWALFIQFDGFPVNADAWTDEFLNYDYIGGPWRDAEQWIVGNGGFSLRSKKLLNLTASLDQDPTTNEVDGGLGMMEDQVICRLNRNYLEEQGIRFAPASVARQFSTVEEFGRVPSLGFHGHHLVPYFLGKELTYAWMDSVDLDYLVYNKNIYTFPYYIWKWGDETKLRDFMLRAEKVNLGWHKKAFEECTWRIPLLFHDADVFEIQKMIIIYGYTGP